MREADEATITAEVLARLSGTPDPRLRQISEALVRHLHAFLREVEPTQQEWAAGIDFLTRVGRMCDDKRQEFILLSDVLGASMLVDAINHRGHQGTTETTVLGPFFVENRPALPAGADISPGVAGTPLHIAGTVSGTDGRPLAGATVDVWHSDEDGFYDVQSREGPAMRGCFTTDARGRFSLWTVRPAAYPIPDDGPVGQMLRAQGRHPFRPEHIHFLIAAPGHRTLVTHLFAEGDPYLDSDAVFGVKGSLVIRYSRHPGGPAPEGRVLDREHLRLHHDFVLGPAAG